MDLESHNGRNGDDSESPEEHRSAHYQNLLDEVLTMMVEDAGDEDSLDDVIDSVMLSLIDAVATQGLRPPRALMDALSAWVGSDDPRAYLRSVYTDERGRLASDTPEPIIRFLRATNEEYWDPDD